MIDHIDGYEKEINAIKHLTLENIKCFFYSGLNTIFLFDRIEAGII